MKKYITPAVEVHNVTPQQMMAVSFDIKNGDTAEQLSREDAFFWSEEED